MFWHGVDAHHKLSRKPLFVIPSNVFTAQRYTSAVYAHAVVMCLSLHLSQAGTTKTAKRRITQTTPNPGTLVFWCQKSRHSSNGITPSGGPNRGGIGLNGDFRPMSRYISETMQDRDMVTINSYVLYRLVLFPVTLSNSNYPKPLHLNILYSILYLRSEWR